MSHDYSFHKALFDKKDTPENTKFEGIKVLKAI